MDCVGVDAVIAGLERLPGRGQSVLVHASLRSFGHVMGGADAVVDALTAVFQTVAVPTFTFSPAALPPEDDRPARNGCDYARDRLGDLSPTPFTADLPAAQPMGAVAEALRKRPGAVRSGHPLSSFAAIGADAQRYVAYHAWDDPFAPIARMLADDGWVLHLGTDLTSCTTIHHGEQRAGRRMFVRWAAVAGQGVRRVRVGGCSAGFGALEGRIADVRETTIGRARVGMMSMRAVVDAVVRAVGSDRLALACPARCRRCRDAADGGPADPGERPGAADADQNL